MPGVSFTHTDMIGNSFAFPGLEPIQRGAARAGD